MRGIAIMLLFMALTYLLVYTLNERAYKEYQRGYNDAVTSQGAIDKACIAWWYQVNIKEVKEKVCGKSDDTKWCSACNKYQDKTMGDWKKCRGTRRWVCISCKERKSDSFFKKKNEVSKVQEL